MNENITVEDALKRCEKYRQKNRVKLFSQCWGCLKFSRNKPEKMCFFNPPKNDGCRFVNTFLEES